MLGMCLPCSMCGRHTTGLVNVGKMSMADARWSHLPVPYVKKMCVDVLQAACWSDAGEMLLFALEGDPSLYYISFHGNEGLSTAIKCADLSSCVVADEIM